MFSDARSKKIVLVAHCILNQNAISDGTVDFPGTNEEIVKLLLQSKVGILQMPCPELNCLGLDRGDVHGGERPVIVENSRIRNALRTTPAARVLKTLVDQLVFQIEEYMRNGFDILGIVGINRSPSCGVNTTSMDSQEVQGEGVFIKTLNEELARRGIEIKMIGIKDSETEKAMMISVRELVSRQ